MNKLLLVAPIFAVLTACASAPIAQPTPSQVQAVQANSQSFKCDNSTEVTSFTTERDGTNYANVKITAPSLGLNQAAMVLKQEVSASGERYTTTSQSGDTVYDWHYKGTMGALTVTHQGKEYSFSCNAI